MNNPVQVKTVGRFVVSLVHLGLYATENGKNFMVRVVGDQRELCDLFEERTCNLEDAQSHFSRLVAELKQHATLSAYIMERANRVYLMMKNTEHHSQHYARAFIGKFGTALHRICPIAYSEFQLKYNVFLKGVGA